MFETAEARRNQQRQDGRPRRGDCEFAESSTGRAAAGGSRLGESSAVRQDPYKHRVERRRIQSADASPVAILEQKLPLCLTPSSDLVTYKTQVESTREWSFDSSTLLRFGLYLLIPVASMIGGALVERVVDMVLD